MHSLKTALWHDGMGVGGWGGPHVDLATLASALGVPQLIKATQAQPERKILGALTRETRPQLPPKHSVAGRGEIGEHKVCLKHFSARLCHYVITSTARLPQHGHMKGKVVILENHPGLQER